MAAWPQCHQCGTAAAIFLADTSARKSSRRRYCRRVPDRRQYAIAGPPLTAAACRYRRHGRQLPAPRVTAAVAMRRTSAAKLRSSAARLRRMGGRTFGRTYVRNRQLVLSGCYAATTTKLLVTAHIPFHAATLIVATRDFVSRLCRVATIKVAAGKGMAASYKWPLEGHL